MAQQSKYSGTLPNVALFRDGSLIEFDYHDGSREAWRREGDRWVEVAIEKRREGDRWKEDGK